MSIIHPSCLATMCETLTASIREGEPAWPHDPLVSLGEICSGGDASDIGCRKLVFSEKLVERAARGFEEAGILGVVHAYFPHGVVDQTIDAETERRALALKMGFDSLPSTTCATILSGWGRGISSRTTLRIYASHGLARGMRHLRGLVDFKDFNRRIVGLSKLLDKLSSNDPGAGMELSRRHELMLEYLRSESGRREDVIAKWKGSRGLFFHHWSLFRRYGLLGLVDCGPELFREGKISMGREAQMVVSKLQKPERTNKFFIDRLRSQGIVADVSGVSKIFRRWRIRRFESRFVDDLRRLSVESMELRGGASKPTGDGCRGARRLVDKNYIQLLDGMERHGLHTDAPGLFILWAYVERLGLFELAHEMGLTRPREKKGYSWFELLLFDIGRIFYGVPSYSAACERSEPTLAFFAGLLKSPCNDTLLDGLADKITERETARMRKELIRMASAAGCLRVRKIALDFHQIDMDVKFASLRKFGKGPSPKKKVCHNGFRPHVAWDVETGCLIAAEFRKSSARGTSTARPFVKELLLDEFKDVFESVYIDSEYTGKDLWSFVLDKDIGMGANLTACLKQNAFVKNARDQFLRRHAGEEDFWRYHDDEHVFSARTFPLRWSVGGRDFSLTCVVKKKVANGKFRVFGTSRRNVDSAAILKDYSTRWIIENGIKDLIVGYYLDQCPGTRPHLVDVHFLAVSICKVIYKMIEMDLDAARDEADDQNSISVRNLDDSVKTIARTREWLIRQGAGRIHYADNTFELKILNPMSPEKTATLRRLYSIIERRHKDGLAIIGGSGLKFTLPPARGEEIRNSLEKIPFPGAERPDIS